MQYHIYKHLALGLNAYKCDIALVALHNIYIYIIIYIIYIYIYFFSVKMSGKKCLVKRKPVVSYNMEKKCKIISLTEQQQIKKVIIVVVIGYEVLSHYMTYGSRWLYE